MTILFDFIFPAIPLVIFSLLSVEISRPFFQSKWAKFCSQTVAAIFLFISTIFLKGISESASTADSEEWLKLLLIIYSMKFIAIYLIACYAKSVNKSAYWSFVGVLNFFFAFLLLVFGLWKAAKQGNLSHAEMINGLKAMLDDPDTPQERRDWAINRLQMLEKIASKK